MPAPLAKGLIITASILVAAGLALYENPQVRQWVDSSRRKIAHAFNDFGDNFQPFQSSRNSTDNAREDEEARRKRREEIMRKNRAELIRRAREEGVAVDLDELSRVGSKKEKLRKETELRTGNEPRSRSFDDIVGSDGMLKSRSVIDEKEGASTTATSVAVDSTDLRRRGQASESFKQGAAFANPFADEHGVDLPSHDSAPSSPADHPLPRETPSANQAETPATVTAESEPFGTPSASIHSLSTLSHSFHSLSPPSDAPSSPSLHSAGTLTPTSDGFSVSGASLTGLSPDLPPTHSPHVLLHHPQPLDLQTPLSLSMHEDGRDVDGMSDAGFSVVSAGTGLGGRSTPGGWTDVGSEEGMSEFGDARVQ